MKNFVDAKWLIENMSDENLIILDATASLSDPLEGERLYNQAHIKGSHFVSLEDVSTGSLGKHGGRHPLPDLKNFIEDMKELGLNNSSKIVIYDDGSIAMAARLWWLLKYIGKEDVYILEGGKRGFIDKGGEVSSKPSQVKEKGDLSLNINTNMNVEMPYLKAKLKDKNTAIVDAREHKRYIGEFEPLDPIAGHIPGTLNYPWTELVEDGKIINLDHAREKLRDLKDYREVIVHCGSGITAIVTLLILDELGINSKLYAGGYSDWLSYSENEVITGEE